jgi:transposase
LEIADREIMEIALQNETHRSGEARYDNRLHGILLACRGMSAYEVGELLGHNSTTIQRWTKSFKVKGFSGVRMRKGRDAGSG